MATLDKKIFLAIEERSKQTKKLNNMVLTVVYPGRFTQSVRARKLLSNA